MDDLTKAELERELETQGEVTERLRRLDKAKDTFVRAVTHELQGPVAAIRAAVALLLADPDTVPEPESRALVKAVEVEAAKIDRLLGDIRDLDQLELRADTESRSPDTGSDLLGRLTRREREVLEHFTRGLSNKAIATRLHIAPATVSTHASNIRKKLGVSSRLEAVALVSATRLGAEAGRRPKRR